MEKQDKNNNITLLRYYCKVVNWIKDMAISTYNENSKSDKDVYKSGLSMSYKSLYIMLQLQAKAFVIPLKILGLDDLEEKDLLSLSLIQGEKAKWQKKCQKSTIMSFQTG